MLRTKYHLEMYTLDPEFAHIFGERDIWIKGMKRKVPMVKVVEPGEIQSPISLFSRSGTYLKFDNLFELSLDGFGCC